MEAYVKKNRANNRRKREGEFPLYYKSRLTRSEMIGHARFCRCTPLESRRIGTHATPHTTINTVHTAESCGEVIVSYECFVSDHSCGAGGSVECGSVLAGVAWCDVTIRASRNSHAVK